MFNKKALSSKATSTKQLPVTSYDGDVIVNEDGGHTVVYEPRAPRHATIKAIIDAEATSSIDADGAFVAYKFVSVA